MSREPRYFTDPRYNRAINELDNNWNYALSMNLSKLDALCAEVCAEFEIDLIGVLTFEQLEPFYGGTRDDRQA
jgi:hypothetical protein